MSEEAQEQTQAGKEVANGESEVRNLINLIRIFKAELQGQGISEPKVKINIIESGYGQNYSMSAEIII